MTPKLLNLNGKPVILAGPCTAESYGMMQETAAFLKEICTTLNAELYFKASFDKANRSSGQSMRGHGMDQVLNWFADLRSALGIKVVTDVHETYQVKPVAEAVDMLQIPAFLCRQTDLVAAAGRSGRAVNIKKGQFMAPGAMGAIADKARQGNPEAPVFLTERGASFGYGDLVVDMRGLALMAQSGTPVLFDMTHSVQKPPQGEGSAVSKANRRFVPLLARAAAATGYLAGFFLEVHPDPVKAASDKDSQLSYGQAEAILKQIIPLLVTSAAARTADETFPDNA